MGHARILALCFAVSLIASPASGELWTGHIDENRSYSIGNEDLGARLDVRSGVANDVRPAAWGSMFGTGMVFGEELEVFAAECHVAGGESRQSFAGLRVAGIQVVSSTEAARQHFRDEAVLSFSTPPIPLFTLGGVVTFSLEFGASAGYEWALTLSPGMTLSGIRGHITGFAEAEVSVSIDILGGIASAGVRAVVRFFDRTLTMTQEVAPNHKWWGARSRGRGVTLRLELFAEIVGLPALTLIIVDVETSTSTEILF